MRKLGVLANCRKKDAAGVLRKLAELSARHGLSLVSDRDTGALLPGCEIQAAADLFERVDAVMALGGDGTMLRVVRALAGRDKPVIGVNIGSLGFLTSVAEQDMERALECLARDQYQISVRAIVEATLLRDGRALASYRGLNEVVVSSVTNRVVDLDVALDGDPVTSYMCDGVIVSTPTGSTGHSLSAGGPILTPETQALLMCLICPHTLSSRPMVVPASSELALSVGGATDRAQVTVDGQVGQMLEPADQVKVRCSSDSVRFIHLPGYSYFRVLRQKLHWSGSNV